MNTRCKDFWKHLLFYITHLSNPHPSICSVMKDLLKTSAFQPSYCMCICFHPGEVQKHFYKNALKINVRLCLDVLSCSVMLFVFFSYLSFFFFILKRYKTVTPHRALPLASFHFSLSYLKKQGCYWLCKCVLIYFYSNVPYRGLHWAGFSVLCPPVPAIFCPVLQ